MSIYYRGTWLRFICALTGHDNRELRFGFPHEPAKTMTLCLRCARTTDQENTK